MGRLRNCEIIHTNNLKSTQTLKQNARSKNIISRAEIKVTTGQAWKAKEIISGSISQWKYSNWKSNPEILELYFYYGQLLFLLGDKMEAGRFMFLSGVRTSESMEPIELFINRYKNPNAMNLYRALPNRGKLNFINLYPPETANDFRSLGMKENLYEAAWISPKSAPEPTTEQLRKWQMREYLSLLLVTTILLLPWLVGVVYLIWFLISVLPNLFSI